MVHILLLLSLILCSLPCTGMAGTPEVPPVIPLTVKETAGVARYGEVVRSGVPLPRSRNVIDPGTLAVTDEGGTPIPAEFTVLARWNAARSDTSSPIQWVLVTFAATVPANGSVRYHLVTDGSAGANPSPSTPVHVTRTGNRVTIDTGAAVFTLGGDPSALFDDISLVSPSTGTTRLVTGGALTGTARGVALKHPTTRSVFVEHTGPLSAVVVVKGAYNMAKYGNGALGSFRRYVFTAGSPTAIVRHAVNWEGDRCGDGVITCKAGPNGVRVQNMRDSLNLSFGSPMTITAVGSFSKPAVSRKISFPQGAWVRQNLRAQRTAPLKFDVAVGAGRDSGVKADGGLIAFSGPKGAIALALNHMHRYEPQALRLTGNKQVAVDLADNLVWIGARQGLFASFAVSALEAGPGRAALDRLVWAPLNRPLRAWPAASVFTRSEAVEEVPVGDIPERLASYDTLIGSILTRTMNKVDEKGLAGLMTFGVYPRYWGSALYGDEIDCAAGSDPTPTEKWDNTYWCATWTDYHNTVATAPIRAMRTGEVEWLDEIGFPGALRTLHTQIMQCGPDDTYFFCGQAPAGYGAYRFDFNSSHAYFDNLFLYYWLTGDYTVVETVKRGAEAMRGYLCARRPGSACLPDDPPTDEWAGLSGRTASQWFSAFRFIGLASDDGTFLEDYRSGLARAVTQYYAQAATGGKDYGFWMETAALKDGPGTYSTAQLWLSTLYDLNNLYRLKRDTNDAAIGNPAIAPSTIMDAWSRTLVTYGSTVSGNGTAAGVWPEALYYTWSGARLGGTLLGVTENTSGSDPHLYGTGKASLTALLLRAGAHSGDQALKKMGRDLTYLALDAAAHDESPLGKVQGLYLSRLHPAVARITAETLRCKGGCPAP